MVLLDDTMFSSCEVTRSTMFGDSPTSIKLAYVPVSVTPEPTSAHVPEYCQQGAEAATQMDCSVARRHWMPEIDTQPTTLIAGPQAVVISALPPATKCRPFPQRPMRHKLPAVRDADAPNPAHQFAARMPPAGSRIPASQPHKPPALTPPASKSRNVGGARFLSSADASDQTTAPSPPASAAAPPYSIVSPAPAVDAPLTRLLHDNRLPGQGAATSAGKMRRDGAPRLPGGEQGRGVRAGAVQRGGLGAAPEGRSQQENRCPDPAQAHRGLGGHMHRPWLPEQMQQRDTNARAARVLRPPMAAHDADSISASARLSACVALPTADAPLLFSTASRPLGPPQPPPAPRGATLDVSSAATAANLAAISLLDSGPQVSGIFGAQTSAWRAPMGALAPQDPPVDCVPPAAALAAPAAAADACATESAAAAHRQDLGWRSNGGGADVGDLKLAEPAAALRVVNAAARRKLALAEVFARHERHLSPFERSEIIGYFPDLYFVGEAAQKVQGDVRLPRNAGYDRDDGHYKIVPHDHLAYRYEITGVLGAGMFSQVVRCFDHKRREWVAIKIIRNNPRFHRQAANERAILACITSNDPGDAACTVKMRSHFVFRSHACIVTELLSHNLYDLMKMNNFAAMSRAVLQRLAHQIATALAYLRRLGVMHCDLKPENILLRSEDACAVKVADFGSSCFVGAWSSAYIQSRFYRAPEVVLGLAYTPAIDIWSFGTILAELYTGAPLFPGDDEQQLLQMMTAVVGPPPEHLLAASQRRSELYDARGAVIPGPKGPADPEAFAADLDDALKGADPGMVDIVKACLRWDPAKRPAPSKLLQHPWFSSLEPRRYSRIVGMEAWVVHGPSAAQAPPNL